MNKNKSVDIRESKCVIFINPASPNLDWEAQRDQYGFVPIGLLYLEGLLRIHGYSVFLVDLYVQKFTSDEFKNYLLSLCSDPVFVGISSYTECADVTLQIAAIVKKIYPGTRIIVGGPHASFCSEEMIQSSDIDFVIRGEAEASVIQLLEHLKYPDHYPVDRVYGIVYKQSDDKLRIASIAPFITALDELPFPDHVLILDMQGYRKLPTFVSSRGCPGECIFCASKALSGRMYRMHSAEWIFSLIYYYFPILKFSSFVPYDDTFTASPKRLEKFCSYIRTFEHKLFWSCKSRVDRLNEKCVKLLKEGYCTSVHIGVESGDEEILRSLQKYITLKQVFHALKLLKQYQILAECSFIIGHPDDTRETITKTIILAEIIEEFHLGSSVIAISTPFPGTEIHKNHEKFGIHIKTKPWYQYNLYTVIYTATGFSEDDLRRGLYYYNYERKHGKTSLGLISPIEEKRIRQHFLADLQL